MDEMQEILEAILQVEAEDEGQIGAIFKSDLSPKGASAVKGILRLINAYKDELPADVMPKMAGLAGYAYPVAKAKNPEDEELLARLKKEEEEGKLKKQKKEKKKEEFEFPMAKSLDGLSDELKKQLEPVLKAQEALHVQSVAKAEERAKDAEERAERIEKALKVERDERQLGEWIAKAETDLSHYPGKSSAELGEMLKTLHDANPEIAQTQFEAMKTASEAISKSALLTNAGTPASMSGGGSAWERIEKKAEQIVQKSDQPLTHAAAIDSVLQAHPELYQEYLTDNPVQSGGRRQ